LLVCDKLKDILGGTLREQVRVAENNKTREFCDLAEYLDTYVSEVTDFIPSEELRGIDIQAANVDVSRGASGQKKNLLPRGRPMGPMIIGTGGLERSLWGKTRI